MFLFPLLGFSRNSVSTPIQSYVSWDGYYNVSDMNLICLYANRSDKEFKEFEKKMLAHHLFVDFKLTENDEIAYVFDMNKYANAWGKFITGKYSTFNLDDKKRIKFYFSNNPASIEYMDSYFSPEKHYDTYANILNVEKELLEEVGELCSLPDLDKETLAVKIKDVQFSNFS